MNFYQWNNKENENQVDDSYNSTSLPLPFSNCFIDSAKWFLRYFSLQSRILLFQNYIAC